MDRKFMKQAIMIILFISIIWISMASIYQQRGYSPTVINVAESALNTEACYITTFDINGFQVHPRANATKMSYSSGTSGTTYFTIPNTAILDQSNVYIQSGGKICFQNATGADTVELIINH